MDLIFVEFLIIFVLVATFGAFAGPVLGYVALSRIQRLEKEVEELQNLLAGTLTEQQNSVNRENSLKETAQNERKDEPRAPNWHPKWVAMDAMTDSDFDESNDPKSDPDAEIGSDSWPEPLDDSEMTSTESVSFMSRIQDNWMVWLGGFCVALAGIFLAKYAMEQGLLGPGARIAGGLLTGLILHGVALKLRLNRGPHPALAALAGGATITLFATLFASFRLYQFFSPVWVFLLLATVALVTMWLALLHGPLLAGIGMIGAYSVPILVSTGSGNLLFAMGYSLIISFASLLLLRYVKVKWLWWGVLAGGAFWWLASMGTSQPDGWRGIYLAFLAYGLLTIPDSDWRLSRIEQGTIWPLDRSVPQAVPHQLGIALLTVLFLISLTMQGWSDSGLNWLLLPALLLWTAGNQRTYTAIACALPVGHLLAILIPQIPESGPLIPLIPIDSARHSDLFLYLLGYMALVLLISYRNFRLGLSNHWWAAAMVCQPVMALIVAYLLAGAFAALHNWALFAGILGAIYLSIAAQGYKKRWKQEMYVWLFLGGHFAYSFAASIFFEQGTLTLAIALQMVTVAWLIHRFEVNAMSWLLKTICVLVVVRLTLNPWMMEYPTETHWTLWTYGGATFCAWLASRWLSKPLSQWTEVTALHLLVLTVWVELRAFLYDGAAFTTDYSFIEATLNTLLFSVMAIVYYAKAKVSESLSGWYRTYSRLQLCFALANYLVMLIAVFVNYSWLESSISSVPVFNMIILSFAAPVFIGYLISRFYDPAWRRYALFYSAVAGLIFVSFEIRHLWQGTLDFSRPTLMGELYSYSVVWLVIAVVAILLGSWWANKSLYQAGLSLLALDILKIFLIDMDDLDGLLRVASFMGLGLALLGIAFLHQKIRPVQDEKMTRQPIEE